MKQAVLDVPSPAQWYVASTLSEADARVYWRLVWHIKNCKEAIRARSITNVLGALMLGTVIAITRSVDWVLPAAAVWIVLIYALGAHFRYHHAAADAIHDPTPQKWADIARVVLPMWERYRSGDPTVSIIIELPE